MFEIMVEDTFDAAHQLVGYDGPCEKLHGHGWKVQVSIAGKELNKLGMLEDFRKVKTDLRNILSKIDHENLNQLQVFRKVNPTSENVAKFIFDRMLKGVGKGLRITKVSVFESPTSCATYTREK